MINIYIFKLYLFFHRVFSKNCTVIRYVVILLVVNLQHVSASLGHIRGSIQQRKNGCWHHRSEF